MKPTPLLAVLTREDALHLSQGRRSKLDPLWLDRPLPTPKEPNVWSTQRKIDSLNAALVGMGR